VQCIDPAELVQKLSSMDSFRLALPLHLLLPATDIVLQKTFLLLAAVAAVQLHPACEAASGEQRVARPLPPQPQLAAQVAGRVAGWSKMRVRDDLGLDKMLAEDAKVGAVTFSFDNSC
jgi:hypothetical protein